MDEEVIITVSKIPKREDIVHGLKKLAFGKANDAVRLIFAGEDGESTVDGLDLSLLSEVKRGSNGTIEVKLINRLEAMALLAKLLDAGKSTGDESAAALFRAMDEAAARNGEAE